MNVKIEFAGQEKGTIPYESLAAVRLLFREWGYQITWDEENRKIQLNPGLSGKVISLSQDSHSYPLSFRRSELEWEMLERIQNFLTGCGAEVILQKNPADRRPADLNLKVSILEIPSIKNPIMNVSYPLKESNLKWLDVLRHECKEAGIEFSSSASEAAFPHMRVQFKYPGMENSALWNKLREKSAIMLAMGVMARLHRDRPLSILSYFPFDELPFWGNDGGKTAGEFIQIEKEYSKKQEAEVKRPKEEKRSGAEVFFDYQVLLGSSSNSKIMVIGNLYIKNTGNEILHNPVICLRATPAENVRISGQIIPKNTTGVLGITSKQGAKGWKYMNDNWLKETQEKGETWITPINHIDIPPGETEILRNFQISISNSEDQENIKVEGFVFFKEQGLEFAANNRIALSL